MSWLTTGNAAKFIGVDRSTLRVWESLGRLHPKYTPGGHRRFDTDELLEVMDRKKPRRYDSEITEEAMQVATNLFRTESPR